MDDISYLYSIDDFVFTIDKNFIIQEANTNFLHIEYLKNNEIIGKRCFDVINRPNKICEGCVALHTHLTKKSQVKEWFDKNSQKYYLILVSPLIGKNGEVNQFVHVAKDITALKENNSHSLEFSLEDQANLLSVVSHEIRTPLTSIKEGVKMLSSHFSSGMNIFQKGILDIVQRNIDRLLRYVNSVMDYKKIESGTEDLNLTNNNINDVITEVYGLMYSLVTNKGLDFKLSLDANIPLLNLDRDRIIQVVTNLVSNAFKFTDSGSIEISSMYHDHIAHVSVRDTGIGMSSEEIPFAFDPFVQFGGFKMKKEGLGIGLTICKEIIKRHKGKIWIESEFRNGVSVHFILPF